MTQIRHTLFISDLHLGARNPSIYKHFIYFLKHIAPNAEALYILGDFFELWLGGDIKNTFYDEIKMHLKKLKDHGTHIYFMKGNRDFLLKTQDVSDFGMTLLDDPCLISLYNKKVLLTHGDRLCTLDAAYQRYRRIANIKPLQWLFLHMPLKLRSYLAETIHSKNPHKDQGMQLDYMIADATPAAIDQDLAKHQADYMIHGHTHRIGVHWTHDKLRVVLGDWQIDYFNYLYVSEDQLLLKSCASPESALSLHQQKENAL